MTHKISSRQWTRVQQSPSLTPPKVGLDLSSPFDLKSILKVHLYGKPYATCVGDDASYSKPHRDHYCLLYSL